MNSRTPPWGGSSSSVYKTTGTFCVLDSGSPTLGRVLETQGALESSWDLQQRLSVGLCGGVGDVEVRGGSTSHEERSACWPERPAARAEGGIIYSSIEALQQDSCWTDKEKKKDKLDGVTKCHIKAQTGV